LAQMHVWPAFRYFDINAPFTAPSISASSNTMNGAFPPNSMDVRFTVEAHWAIKVFPTAVEPMKLSFLTIGFVESSSLISFGDPVTHDNTPFGTPARLARTHRARADNGVSLAGLITIVQPAASAGPALRVIIAAGKFHGVMAAHTPIACFTKTILLSDVGAGTVSP